MISAKIISRTMAVACTALLVLTNVFFAKAQLGFTGGVNLANVAGDGSGDHDMKTGFYLGAVFDLGITDNIFIEPGAIFSMKGAQSKENSDAKLTLNYFEIPVVAKYKWKSGFNVFLGPYLGVLMSAVYNPGGTDVKSFYSNTDVGLKAGLGMRLLGSLGINAHYELGFSNINDVTTTSNTNAVIGIGLTYMLGEK